jgi:hypothetical protein
MRDRPKTKAAAYAEVRELIDRFSTGEPWPDEARERLSAITNLDLKYVVKKENPEFPSDNRHIHVLAYDWTSPAQWSWRKAIDAAYAKDLQKYHLEKQFQKNIAALRVAIREQMRAFRDQCAEQICANENCGTIYDITVDHLGEPFISIASDFLKARSIRLVQMDGIGDVMADADVEAEWVEFHGKRAAYQLLCRQCNSSKGAGGYKR